jgi:thiamine-phosphate pyrophosphorylase
MTFGHAPRAILCLVTDRWRLAARLAWSSDASACLVEQIAAAAASGVDLVHLRERDLDGRELLELAAACVRATRGTATRVVVNDRMDVALAAGAAGVHLRGDSVDSASARAIAPEGFVIGRSVHGVADAIEEGRRGCCDYLVLGTMFPTRSKAAPDTVIGPAALSSVTAAVSVPVLGIGGVTQSTLPALAACGARGFAAIGWFIDAFLCAEPGVGIGPHVAMARRLFDTPGSIP